MEIAFKQWGWLGQDPQPLLTLLALSGTPNQPGLPSSLLSQGFIECYIKTLSVVRFKVKCCKEVSHTQSVGHKSWPSYKVP